MITKYDEFLNESENNWTEKDPEFYEITKYKWNNGLLDCYEDVLLFYRNLKVLPFKFGKIEGKFYCCVNDLTSLEGAPHTVTDKFDCSECKITSLEYGPKFVGSSFYCQDNKLENLKGCPEKIFNVFDCTKNKLTSFEYGPKFVGSSFYCTDNDFITNIEDYPLCIIGNFISDSIFVFSTLKRIVKENEEKFIPLLDDKVRFHQMVMRINPSTIKYYTTIQPPSKKTIL